VRRDEREAAGTQYTTDLPQSRGRVTHVLEHLRAQDEVDRRGVDVEAFDGTHPVDQGAGHDVGAEVRPRPRREQRIVGLVLATDVEDVQIAGQVAISRFA
jgi:hypothetical protein